MKKALPAITILVVLIAVGWWAGRRAYELTLPPGGGKKVVFRVERGHSLSEVARELQKEELVRSARYIEWLGRKQEVATLIKAGEYELSSDWTPQHMLDVLTEGKVISKRFTIPEGFTLKQIAEKLDREKVLVETEFVQAASETAPISRWLAPKTRNLEGVLFPDTYTYTSDDNAASIVRMMTDRFEKVFEKSWNTRHPDLNLEPYQVVILASIVEKETAAPEERPLVAGVFINRLRKGIRLMSDPTVIYGIPNFNGNLTRADLRKPSPYNTYLNQGLPPGPICNPGAPSIEAALQPAPTDALYFVARGDGKHHFSATIEEHNDAVRRYQKRRGG